MDICELERRSDRQVERLLSNKKGARVLASEKLPPHCTARELDILKALTVLRFASVDQLVSYLPRYKRGVQRSLEVLRSKRLVGWFRWVDTAGVQEGLDPLTTIPIYCLTTKGVERCILDRAIEDDTYLVTRSWRGKPVVHSLMPHHLGLVRIIQGLSLASRRSNSHQLLWTLPDFVFEEIDEKNRIATIEMLGTENELRADLIACTRNKNSGRLVNAYIELERRSKSSQEIIKKFVNYSVLFKAPKRRFNDGAPVLLYVITDCKEERDTKNRIELVRSWVNKHPVAPAFRVTTLNALEKNAFGPIWQKADGSVWSIEK